ncbi:MAG: hypothetical protein ACYC6N_05020 [Pirellulaceae bacterium]
MRIKAFLDNWRNRPVTAKGTRCSKIFAEVTIGEFYRFLNWTEVEDFHFNQQHPHAKLIRYDGIHDWLITTRRKAYTHSEALLWPWVAEIVKQQIAVCKANGWPTCSQKTVSHSTEIMRFTLSLVCHCPTRLSQNHGLSDGSQTLLIWP